MEDPVKPKRRGRPPKNKIERVPPQSNEIPIVGESTLVFEPPPPKPMIIETGSVAPLVTTFQSTRGGTKLSISGYNFDFERINADKTKAWSYCKERAKTREEDGVIVLLTHNDHNHEPCAVRKPVAAVLDKLKKISKTTSEKPCQIIQSLRSECSDVAVGASLSSKSALKQTIKRARGTSSNIKEPDSLSFEIPDELKKIGQELFIVNNEIYGGNRIIMCTTEENMKLLSKSPFILMDGTFKVVPAIFQQLYTIHDAVGPRNSIFPLVYAFLTSKSEKAYDKLFSMLIDHGKNLNLRIDPKYTLTDFERATLNSVENVFEGSKAKLCHFHFGQIIWRHVQSCGLASLYGNNAEFAICIRLLIALSFCPQNAFQKGLLLLNRNCPTSLSRW